jgi:hypothetical protein
MRKTLAISWAARRRCSTKLAVVDLRGDREVLGVALDHQDAGGPRLGLQLFLRAALVTERRALTQPQHAGGPRGAAASAGVEVAQRVLDQLVGEAEHAGCLRDGAKAPVTLIPLSV